VPRLVGWSQLYRVERLITPKVSIKDNLIYETPFPVEWKRADSKKFSVLRKSVYKSTVPIPSELFEYSNPLFKLKKTKKIKLDITAQSISDWYDLRLIANYGFTVGRITSGLYGLDLLKALFQCKYAPNPFEAYASGGIKVLTAWRAPCVVSKEWLDVVDTLMSEVDKISLYMTDRVDLDEFDHQAFLDKKKVPMKRQLENSVSIDRDSNINTIDEISQFKRIRFTDSMSVALSDVRQDVSQYVSNVLEDLKERGLEPVHVEPFSFDDEEDLDHFLEDSEFEL
jgi:hypothetical protein